MAKIALLIGVSDYGAGFDSVPRAQHNVQAMQQVLQKPEIGFSQVKALLNPDRQAMIEAIEALFSEHSADSLILLYFYGYGIKDDGGKLYLTTTISRKSVQKKLIKSSAVPVSFVQEVMRDSRSQQQVVILDCCSSTFIPDNSAGTGIPTRTAYPQTTDWLCREGQAALVSLTSTQYDFEQNESGLSVYTRYLVEGMETGVADLDEDGVISVAELHRYTSRKVQTIIPAVQPEMYGADASHSIILAKAPIDDSKWKYRKEVERCATSGEISIVSRSVLDLLRDTLGLQRDEAAAIEAGVLEPHLEYQKKLQRYAQGFVEAIRHESPIREVTRNKLKGFQQTLGLTSADVALIEVQVAQRRGSLQSSSQVAEPARAQRTIALLNETVKPNKTVKLANQLNTATASRTVTPTLTGAAVSSWDRSTYPPALASESFQRLAGIGIVIFLALIGIVYGLPFLRTVSALKPVSEPEPPLATTPTPLSTSVPETVPIPLPKSSLPLVAKPSPPSRQTPAPTPASQPKPTSVSDPSSQPKPATAKSKPPSTLSSQPKPVAAKSESVSTSVTKSKPSSTSVRKPKTPSSARKPKSSSSRRTPPQISRRRSALTAPEAPPTSWSEPPPASAPEPTSSAPEAPPTSWSEPPPASAPPDSNY